MKDTGLTLVEILVAMTVLAVGAAAIVGLQVSTLKLTARTQLQTRLLHVAETELQRRLLHEPAGTNCSAVPPGQLAGLECHAAETTCSVSPGGLDCTAGSGGPVRHVTVSVRGSVTEDGPMVTLSSSTRNGSGP